ASWVGSGWIMWAAPVGTIVTGCPTPQFIGNCRVCAAAALCADSSIYRRFLIRQSELASCDSWAIDAAVALSEPHLDRQAAALAASGGATQRYRSFARTAAAVVRPKSRAPFAW